MKDKPTKKKKTYEELKDNPLGDYFTLCKEIDGGPFSILSNNARDRIKTMIRLSTEAGYNRGAENGLAGRGFIG